MTELEFQAFRVTAFAFAVALAFLLERRWSHSRAAPSLRENGSLWAIDVVVTGVVCGACACTVANLAEGAGFGLLNQSRARPIVAVGLTLLSLDAVSYAWHRANHRFSFLWRFHRVHHSDRTFTASTALRFHPGELLLSLPIRLAAVAGLGAPVEGIILFESIFAVSNLIEHGDIRIGPRWERGLARLVVTPALHRRHHSVRRSHLDTNFGTILTVWDRAFGTFGASSSSETYEIGLPGLPGLSGIGELVALPVRISRLGS